MEPTTMDEIKALIEAQGKAFDEFKAAHAAEIKELKAGRPDPLTTEKLARLEKALDDKAEAHAALMARLEAEKKEREDLELRLTRRGVKADDETAKHAGQFETELKSFAAERGRAFGAFGGDAYAAYKDALGAWLREGKDNLAPEQIKALQVGVDSDGGYLVTPDMSGRIVTKVFESSPIRQIASVTTISTDALEGIEDIDEAAASWVGETATRSVTDTPEVGKWRIPVHELAAMPQATQKMLDDASVNVEAWLAMKVADKFARAEAAAFVTGNGVAQPRGFTDYTTAADSGSGVTWGTIGHVVSGANGDFAGSDPADKLMDLVGTVKAEYLPNARWVTRRAVITKIRKFKNGSGDYVWQPALTLGTPETVLGFPITRAEDMPTLATGSLSLFFGDFRAAYQIVDRIGLRTLRDPYTNKPYVRFYTTRRVGGGVVNFEAIKAMKFST